MHLIKCRPARTLLVHSRALQEGYTVGLLEPLEPWKRRRGNRNGFPNLAYRPDPYATRWRYTATGFSFSFQKRKRQRTAAQTHTPENGHGFLPWSLKCGITESRGKFPPGSPVTPPKNPKNRLQRETQSKQGS